MSTAISFNHSPGISHPGNTKDKLTDSRQGFTLMKKGDGLV